MASFCQFLDRVVDVSPKMRLLWCCQSHVITENIGISNKISVIPTFQVQDIPTVYKYGYWLLTSRPYPKPKEFTCHLSVFV